MALSLRRTFTEHTLRKHKMLQALGIVAIVLVDVLFISVLYAYAIKHAGEEQDNEKH